MTTDSLIVITPIQLKKTNLIFLEHKMLLNKVPLLESQVSNLEKINGTLEKSDSIKQAQIDCYINYLEDKENTIAELSSSLSSYKNKCSSLKKWAFGGVGASILLMIITILK